MSSTGWRGIKRNVSSTPPGTSVPRIETSLEPRIACQAVPRPAQRLKLQRLPGLDGEQAEERSPNRPGDPRSAVERRSRSCRQALDRIGILRAGPAGAGENARPAATTHQGQYRIIKRRAGFGSRARISGPRLRESTHEMRSSWSNSSRMISSWLPLSVLEYVRYTRSEIRLPSVKRAVAVSERRAISSLESPSCGTICTTSTGRNSRTTLETVDDDRTGEEDGAGDLHGLACSAAFEA